MENIERSVSKCRYRILMIIDYYNTITDIVISCVNSHQQSLAQ